MKKSFLYLLPLFVLSNSCVSEKTFDRIERKIGSKPLAAEYSGGHHFYIDLALFKDGTYFYVVVPDFMGFVQRQNGKYKLDSNSIWLSKMGTFRVKNDAVLLYTEKHEQSKDSSFYKDYYTLTLDK